jgi:hypothetical protein
VPVPSQQPRGQLAALQTHALVQVEPQPSLAPPQATVQLGVQQPPS